MVFFKKYSFFTLTILTFLSCRDDANDIYEEVFQISNLKKPDSIELVKTGHESGFIEPMVVYAIYKTNGKEFQSLKNQIQFNKMFSKGLYYLNLEVDSFLHTNSLDIINISKCRVSTNPFKNEYRLFLLSDEKTFIIFKLNT